MNRKENPEEFANKVDRLFEVRLEAEKLSKEREANGGATFKMYHDVVVSAAKRKFKNMTEERINEGIKINYSFLVQCYKYDLTADQAVFQMTI